MAKSPRKGYESSRLSARDEEQLAPMAMKKRSQAVMGQPDRTDIDNLNYIFSQYEKAHPGRLERMRKDYEVSRALKEKLPKPKDMGVDARLAFWMPGDLQEILEKYYPSLWSNQKHVRWFLRHYPGFKG